MKEKKRRILLTEQEYCHVINKRTGKIDLIEGPDRVTFLPLSFKTLYGLVKKKIVLADGHYVIILNPYERNKKQLYYGDREVRIGPQMFSLHPGEEIDLTYSVGTKMQENGIKGIYILERNKGLILKALRDFDDEGIERKAGDEWIIKGPIHYVPHKYVTVIRIIEEISLAEHSGIYIKNTKTGDIRLEQGAKNIMLGPDEELFSKEFTNSEKDAIKFAQEYDWTMGRPLWVLQDEVTKIMSETNQKIIFGPKVIMLNAFERPYIMTISAGTPKGSTMLKRWKLTLGPRFVSDILDIRTKDNAVLQIKLRYKTRFKIDPENHDKLFAVSDFIGLATQTMAGIIREECANHDFEALHSKAMTIIKDAIFGENDSFIFEENGFEIFDVDIKEIIPKDIEIAEKMNDAIKSNMQIYVEKMRQHAKIEAEKQDIEGKKIIEEKRVELLKLEHENKKAEEMLNTEIQVEQILRIAEAEAEAIKIKKTAEKEVEVSKIKEVIAAINNDGTNYLKLQQILSLESIQKMAIVPSNSNMFLPIKDILEDL